MNTDQLESEIRIQLRKLGCVKNLGTYKVVTDNKIEAIIKSAIEKATKAQTVILGFASWQDGRFELIVRDEESYEETTLKGKLDDGQFEVVNKILPTCVFIQAAVEAQKENQTRAAHASEQDFIKGFKRGWMRACVFYVDIDAEFLDHDCSKQLALRLKEFDSRAAPYSTEDTQGKHASDKEVRRIAAIAGLPVSTPESRERCPGPRQHGHPLIYESHCDHGKTTAHKIIKPTGVLLNRGTCYASDSKPL